MTRDEQYIKLVDILAQYMRDISAAITTDYVTLESIERVLVKAQNAVRKI